MESKEKLEILMSLIEEFAKEFDIDLVVNGYELKNLYRVVINHPKTRGEHIEDTTNSPEINS